MRIVDLSHALEPGMPSYPGWTAAACEKLIQHRVALVGVDFANVDDMNGHRRPAHTLLLGAGIPVVEHLCQLDQLPPSGFRFFAVPPKVKGGTSFPVRALALLS
jgi:arylformamidase